MSIEPTPSDPLCQRFDAIVVVLAADMPAAWADLHNHPRFYKRTGNDRGMIRISDIEEYPMKFAPFRIVTWDQGERALRGYRVREVIDLHGAPMKLAVIAREHLKRWEASQ